MPTADTLQALGSTFVLFLVLVQFCVKPQFRVQLVLKREDMKVHFQRQPLVPLCGNFRRSVANISYNSPHSYFAYVVLLLVPSQYSFDGYNLYNSRLKREFVSIISTLTGY